MTQLQRLIQAQAQRATVMTLSGATERIAEEMAREMLRDPVFRAEIQTLVRNAFSATIRQLTANGKGARRRTKRRPSRT